MVNKAIITLRMSKLHDTIFVITDKKHFKTLKTLNINTIEKKQSYYMVNIVHM